MAGLTVAQAIEVLQALPPEKELRYFDTEWALLIPITRIEFDETEDRVVLVEGDE